MKNAIKIGALLLVLLAVGGIAKADEPPRTIPAHVQNDSLLQKAYRTRNRHIIAFIKEQERKNGREGLRDANFRAELKGKLDLLASNEAEGRTTEAQHCASCERTRSQLNDSEVKKLRALLAAAEQNQRPVMPMNQANAFGFQQMNQGFPSMNQGGAFGFQQQGFGGNFFNTSGSMNQGGGIAGLFAQLLGGLSGGNQGYGYGYGNNQYPRYSNQYFGNQMYARRPMFNQAPAIAGVPNYSFGQAPAIAGPANTGIYNYGGAVNPAYSNITSNHYSLINGSSAPAVLPMR